MTRYTAETKIDIGNHFTVGGFNLDTIWATAFAGLVVILFGVLIARRATSGVPRGPQLLWETIVSGIENQVEQSLGVRAAPFAVPLGVAIFVFILVANWLELIPTLHYLPSPTADVNLTYALALFVVVWVHVFGSQRGGRKYWGHFFKPLYLAPINIIEEIAKPLTLALRLFGNIFSGGIMISLIALFPAYIVWAPNAAWKLFDMFIGVIQAFIFALLTILYFSFAQTATQEGGH